MRSSGAGSPEPVVNGVRLAGILFVILSIFWTFQVHEELRIHFGILQNLKPLREQFLALMLTLILPMVYLYVPAGKGRQRTGPVPWYDWGLAAIGLAAGAYLTINFKPMQAELTFATTEAIIVGLIILPLCLEGLRRTTGSVLLAIVLLFVAIGLLGHHIPPPLQTLKTSFHRFVPYQLLDTSALVGLPLRVVTSIVVSFLLMGALLQRSGGGQFFTDISMSLMGRYRGGAAKISIIASSLFGSISGSAVSNVVSTGVVTIPMMRKSGYKAHTAGAIEAVASSGGQLMPPVMGAAAFLMADILEVPYSNIVIAALLPSALYYFALLIQVDLEAAKAGIPRVEESLIEPVGRVFRQGWYFLLPFVVLIYTLFWRNFEPEKSALFACATLIIVGTVFSYKGRRLGAKDVPGAAGDTGILMLDITMIAAGVGIVIGVLLQSGFGQALTLFLVSLGRDNVIALLLLAAFTSIILGMGMPTIAVYLLLASLVAPAMIAVGIDPMAAHLYVLYFGMMSFITPPVAIAAFVAATVAKANNMRVAFSSVRLAWSAFLVPFLFVASPTLLLDGPLGVVIIAVLTAMAGVAFASFGIMGYLLGPLNMFWRLAAGTGGVLLLIPSAAFDQGYVTDIAGAALCAVFLLFELRRHYQAQRADQPAQ